ncbi:hypothetical protein [Asanoa siamensis]|uniref:Uncharacterized protein n=1 Tax=Asanoa siamensis TaxID=926357 RepID=A0ABQ4CIM0_9ACTN|nr:hypothetical protein [Asanoa siamensis]GIF70823.1 hypothetical protein Asi02nite_03410 [Asanoa siamensis]
MSDEELLSDSEEERRSAAARMFDVRRVIGGLFVVYGVIVSLVGAFDGAGALDKAQGVRINLWAGLAMLAVGVLFLVWQWISPAEAPASDDSAGDAVENGEGDASVR